MSKLVRVAASAVRIEVIVKSAPASKSAAVNHAVVDGQGLGDERRAGGDEITGSGTAGTHGGLSGEERDALRTGWPVGLAIVAMVMVFDILTRAHDQPRALGRAVIDEASSAVVTSILLLFPFALAIWVRRRAPARWKVALAYLVGAVAYAALHVSAFVGIRKAAYAAFLGHGYDFGPPVSEFLYEAGKDVPAFAFASVIFWLILRWRAETAAPAARSAPQVFDIRDGARLVRAPLSAIVAIRSAGNYAEFLLDDGRRPLMRTSLNALQARLAPHGFVRTHRSWLINPAQVTGLRPEGSGDYAVELGALEAPLSRRFPQALKSLRP